MMNSLFKQKREMFCTMRKPCALTMKIFAAWLMELKYYLPLLTWYDDLNKTEYEELN